jgi:hypothetical protein
VCVAADEALAQAACKISLHIGVLYSPDQHIHMQHIHASFACSECLCLALQASFAFNVLEEALRLILEKMEDLSSLAAETGRLAGLLAALRAADVDAGGDGTVVGFGALPKHLGGGGGSSSSSKQGQLLDMKTSQLPAGQDSSSNMHDVELADRSAETDQLLQGVNSTSGVDGSGGSSGNGALLDGLGSGARLSRVLRLMDGSVPGLVVDGLTACVPGRHHQPTVVCQDLTFSLQPGEADSLAGGQRSRYP